MQSHSVGGPGSIPPVGGDLTEEVKSGSVEPVPTFSGPEPLNEEPPKKPPMAFDPYRVMGDFE